MFWKVAGFSQPSPIEQILDKEEFTLEELLDEDDIIQECKSLNGRLVAFLRERSTVEQLVRYLVEPALDSDDPKRTYKFPFTACEVFCCEVEAVYNTLLEDAELMKLLFSLLGDSGPLNCKTAGYFGRVVSNLLLRKTSEVMQYMQDNPSILEGLIRHVDTTSIADIIKRLVGADDQFNSISMPPNYAEWLAETPLVDMLLARLSEGHHPEAQANAADILSTIAHTQPSPLASRLTREESIGVLFQHAMSPGGQVLVPSLDVCIALVEPRRSMQQEMAAAEGGAAEQPSKDEAIAAIVKHVPTLVSMLQSPTDRTQETPFGYLVPPLGRARLKIVELFAVLMRSNSTAGEQALIQAGALKLCISLFANYPFNNLLHHGVSAMLVAALSRGSDDMLQHLFGDCKIIDWLVSLPVDVRPMPRPGNEEAAASKTPLRAGYLGHVTQIASTLDNYAQQQQQEGGDSGEGSLPGPRIAAFLDVDDSWKRYREEVLHPRQDLENTARWACGRPAATELGGLDSDGDEYQNDMDLEQIQGLQPGLYHRYNNVYENDDEDEDESHGAFGTTSYGAQMITEAISGLDVGEGSDDGFNDNLELGRDIRDISEGLGSGPPGGKGMEDDEVLLATSDDDDLLEEGAGGAAAGSPPAGGGGSRGQGEEPASGGEGAAAAQEGGEDAEAGSAGVRSPLGVRTDGPGGTSTSDESDMVLVEEVPEGAGVKGSPGAQQRLKGGVSPSKAEDASAAEDEVVVAPADMPAGQAGEAEAWDRLVASGKQQ